jgi:hypothetical protein
MAEIIEAKHDELVNGKDPEIANCPRCNGVGTIFDSGESSRECGCTFKLRVRSKLGVLGRFIPWVQSIPGSPLCEEHLNRNMVFKGPWTVLAPYLAFTLGCKAKNADYSWRFSCPTDYEIVDASFSDKDNRKPERIETSDLLGPQFALVLVRLGFMDGANKRAASILLESIRNREAKGKPTWISVPSDFTFDKGYPGWSERLETYLGGLTTVKFSESDRLPL